MNEEMQNLLAERDQLKEELGMCRDDYRVLTEKVVELIEATRALNQRARQLDEENKILRVACAATGHVLSDLRPV